MLHICGCEPLHCVEPGLQTPAHALPTHAWSGHPKGVPHCPTLLHSWILVSLAHCVWFGPHAPWHVPERHVRLVEQGLVLPHWPLLSHVCTLLPEHCFEPGTHTPEQLPELHT
jgi:hypothetical protein